jgi:hypothetical protein
MRRYLRGKRKGSEKQGTGPDDFPHIVRASWLDGELPSV